MMVFFFTDIEGSTRLWEEHTSEMGKVIARHDAILQQQIETSGGRITKHTGDGVTAAFDDGEPLNCALQTQQRFGSEAWGAIGELRIRIGLNGGEAELHAGDYFGPPVNCTARVMSAGWGGQILLTPAVSSVSPLPTEATLRDLGQHLLKDVSAPQQIYQLLHPELPRLEFPPLRTLSGSSVGRAVSEQGQRLAKLPGSAMAIDLVSATLLPILQGDLSPGSPALAGNLGILADLGAGSLQSFVGEFAEGLRARQQGDEVLSEAEIRDELEALLLERWQAGGKLAVALRKDTSLLLQAVQGVEAAMQAATADLKETLAQGLADLGGSFREFRWVLDEVAQTLAELRTRQALQLAMQREQLDLQAQQLVKTQLLLHLQQERASAPMLAGLREAKEEEAPAADVPCPYKGLAAFGPEDAAYFFGRGELVAQLTARLAGTAFLAVVGPSGSGKSSVVRAGLLPAIWQGALPNSKDWKTLVLTPGHHPLNELAVRISMLNGFTPVALLRDLEVDHRALDLAVRRVLANQPHHVRLLLLVDQFEEVFALCHDDDERRQFIDALLYAVEAEDSRMVVVPTIRADFYGHCADYPNLAARLRDNALVGPLSEDELRQVIERPAELVGLRLQPGLMETIMSDVIDEPGALPLLSHALLETWQRRRGRTLSLTGYFESGGVAGAIAQTADTVLQQSAPEQQAHVRNIFLRLTELGEEGTQDTRRRVAPSELIPRPEEAPAVEAVLKTLTDARLIISGEDTVEVAHEALIREWPTLRGWLDQDREGLRTHRHLTEAAQEWERLEREPGELYRGARLATASEWAEAHAEALNPLEAEFVKASQELVRLEQAQREAQRQRELEAAQRVAEAERKRAEEQGKATGRFRRLALGLAMVFLVAVAAAVAAFNARATSQREAAVNHSLVLAANAEQAQDNGEVDLALALALEAVTMDQPPWEAVRTLSALALGPGTRAILPGHSNGVRDVAFSPDGRTALSGSCGQLDSAAACVQGELTLWDLSAAAGRADGVGTRLRRFEGHTGWVNSIAFSPDGQTAISASSDASLVLWDVETGDMMRRIDGHAGGVNSVAFSSDGLTALSGSDDTTLILWDVTSGEAIRRFEGHTAGVNRVAFSSDDQTALSGSADATLILWDVTSGDRIRRFEGHTDEVTGVAFNQDGRTMLSTGDNTLRLWDLETGEQIRQEHFPSFPQLFGVSPDGRTAMFGLESLRLWDIQRWREAQSLTSVSVDVWPEFAAFSPDGRVALSGSCDGSLTLWNLGSQGQLRRLAADGTPLSAVAIGPDGRRLLTGDMAGAAVLWDIERGEVIRRLEGDAFTVSPNSIAFSPDGRIALVGSGDTFGGSGARSLALWDIETGQEIRRFEGHRFILRSVALGPDGRVALAGSQSVDEGGEEDGDLILWDLETGDQIRRFDTSQDITSIAFTADGSRALTGSAYSSNLTLWDVPTGREIRRLEHSSMVFDVALGPDETTALSASADGSLLLWDLETGDVIRRYLGHESVVWTFDISPDWRYLISGSMDGTVILWDLETAEELRRFSGHTEIVFGVVFSPDGQTAFSVSADGALIEWQVADLALDELIDWTHANRYVRDLTCEEREQYRVEPPCDSEGVVAGSVR